MKNLMMMLTLLVFTVNAQAQKEKKIEIAAIKTSAVCDMCKETLEKAMAYEKGVKQSDLNVETKVLTVSFDPSKTSIEKIRKAVTMAGYDADDMKADPKAYEALHACCKKDAPH